MKKRIISDFFIFFAIFFCGPFLPMIMAILCLFFFEYFYEIIIAGIMIDVLYGSPIPNLFGFSHIATFTAIALFVSSIMLKKRLKFYANKF